MCAEKECAEIRAFDQRCPSGDDIARATDFKVGERVYGVKPPSQDGAHASHIVAKAEHARRAPDGEDIRALAALPYSFITMWLAATAAGLTRANAPGKKILVNGAAGGLGTLALQTLSEWGACATAVAKASDLDACIAAEVVDRDLCGLSKVFFRFDAAAHAALTHALTNVPHSCGRIEHRVETAQ